MVANLVTMVKKILLLQSFITLIFISFHAQAEVKVYQTAEIISHFPDEKLDAQMMTDVFNLMFSISESFKLYGEQWVKKDKSLNYTVYHVLKKEMSVVLPYYERLGFMGLAAFAYQTSTWRKHGMSMSQIEESVGKLVTMANRQSQISDNILLQLFKKDLSIDELRGLQQGLLALEESILEVSPIVKRQEKAFNKLKRNFAEIGFWTTLRSNFEVFKSSKESKKRQSQEYLDLPLKFRLIRHLRLVTEGAISVLEKKDCLDYLTGNTGGFA